MPPPLLFALFADVINSSHNSYLDGHQFIGRASADMYRRILLQGCRCLEIDCYDGGDGEPRVTHGRSLVTSIPLAEALAAIEQCAFATTDFPLILSLEMHCSPPQQASRADAPTRSLIAQHCTAPLLCRL